MKPTPSFPTSVWNGSNTTRTNYGSDHLDPVQDDYDRLTEEIRAVQSDMRSYTPCIFRITVSNTAGDYDLIVPYAVTVLDVFATKTSANGASGDAVILKNGSTAISNSMSLNINDQLLARATSINDAAHSLAAGDTLRVTATKATNCEAIVTVLCLKA